MNCAQGMRNRGWGGDEMEAGSGNHSWGGDERRAWGLTDCVVGCVTVSECVSA